MTAPVEVWPLDLDLAPDTDPAAEMSSSDAATRGGARVRERLPQDTSDADVLVLDATLVGDTRPARTLVVEVMHRAEEILGERVGATGITRLVRVGRAVLVDAGARPVEGGRIALPPADPARAAGDLWATLPDLGGVVLTSRATPDGSPAVLATAGRLRADTAAAAAQAAAATTALATVVRGLDLDGTSDPEHVRPWGDVDGPSYDHVRALFGLRPGTPEALEIGLPRRAHEDDVESRVERACRLALLPLPEVSTWHPVRRHVRTSIDLRGVRTSVLQIGVRVEAPDAATLGVAVGRLVLALAVEGVSATPIQWEEALEGSTALVAFLGDTTPPPPSQ